MKSTLWVHIEAGKSEVRGILVREALLKEADGRALAFEVRTAGGVLTPFAGSPVPGDRLLLVNGAQAEGEFVSLPYLAVGLDEALDNPGALLQRLETENVLPPVQRAPTPVGKGGSGGRKRIVAVTACPTGVAHTCMAAEGLQQGAKTLGYDIRVEMQGAVGVRTPLTSGEIDAADLVIIAAECEVDRSRFNGKMVFASNTKGAITNAKDYITRAFAEAAHQGDKSAAHAGNGQKRAGHDKRLMTGVSFAAGAMSMWLGTNLMAPYGGIFVLPVPNAIRNVPGYLVAIVTGAAVSVLLLGLLKKSVQK